MIHMALALVVRPARRRRSGRAGGRRSRQVCRRRRSRALIERTFAVKIRGVRAPQRRRRRRQSRTTWWVMALRGERSPSSQGVVLSPQAESLRAHMRHERHSRHSHRRRRRYCARPSPIMPRPRVAQLSTRADRTMLREGNVGAGNMRCPNNLAIGTKHPKADAAADRITQTVASHVVPKYGMQGLSRVDAVLRSEPRKPRRRRRHPTDRH